VIVLSEQFTSSKSAASKTGKTASFSFTPQQGAALAAERQPAQQFGGEHLQRLGQCLADQFAGR
jgi:hypothetical protein